MQKLPKNLRNKLLLVVELIYQNDLSNLDIKLLSGHKDVYRCRVGKIRIIFRQSNHFENIILEIGFRGDIYK